MSNRVFTFLCWMVLGAGVYVAGCAVVDPLVDRIPTKWLRAVAGAAEKGAAAGAGTAVAAAEAGDWKTAGTGGVIGLGLAVLGVFARSALKRRGERNGTQGTGARDRPDV